MPYPCIGSQDNVLRIKTSTIPWSRSSVCVMPSPHTSCGVECPALPLKSTPIIHAALDWRARPLILNRLSQPRTPLMPFRAFWIALAFIVLGAALVLGQQDSTPRQPNRRSTAVKARDAAVRDSMTRDSQPVWPLPPTPL